MSSCVFVYRTSPDYTGSAEAVTAWNDWFERLGSHRQDRGNPVFARTTVGARPSETVLGGYSIITAVDLDAAAILARDCPALGGVEIGELTLLNRGTAMITDTHP